MESVRKPYPDEIRTVKRTSSRIATNLSNSGRIKSPNNLSYRIQSSKSKKGKSIAIILLLLIGALSLPLFLPPYDDDQSDEDLREDDPNGDYDKDGYKNSIDKFPQDKNEWEDTDDDGIGNNADDDDDNDGIKDVNDKFPEDPEEWEDTDRDRIGNNRDEDDDNDGMPDEYEIEHGFDPLDDADADEDSDGDRYTNLEEYEENTNPKDEMDYPRSGLDFIHYKTIPSAGIALAITFSPNGTYAAGGYSDNKIVIWNTEDWSVSQVLSSHSERVLSLAFSPNGLFLASGSADDTIRIWSTTTWTNIKRMTQHTGNIHAITFSPDGTRLVSASQYHRIRVWDTTTWSNIETKKNHSALVNSISFSPDGKYLASGSYDNTVNIWDTSTWTVSKTLTAHGSNVYAVAFSPDGKVLASGSADATTIIHDVSTWNNIATLKGHSRRVSELAFSPDGKYLASGGYLGSIAIWDTDTWKGWRTLNAHSDLIDALTFSPLSDMLIIGSEDKSSTVWDTNNWTLQQTLAGHSNEITFVKYSQMDNQLMSCDENAVIIDWDTILWKSQELVGLSEMSRLYSAVLSQDQKMLAVGYYNELRIWLTSSWSNIEYKTGTFKGVQALAFSPDGNYLAMATGDKTILVFDTMTWATIATLSGHTGYIYSIQFSPDGRHIISGGSDGSIIVWKTATWTLFNNLSGHSQHVNALAFSHDNLYFASGSSDKTIRIWTTSTWTSVKSISGHTESITSLCFSPYNNYLVSGSGDKTVKIWSASSWDLLQSLGGHSHTITSIDISKNGNFITCGLRNGEMHIWWNSDHDHDRIDDESDPDDDNDGIPDVEDVFPFDPNEWHDYDNDGIGDNADEDNDNDGIPNISDEYPWDTDNDGMDNTADPDDDNDGIPDYTNGLIRDFENNNDAIYDEGEYDEVPLDAEEWCDTDRDKIGNTEDDDDDDDGIRDSEDIWPLNSDYYLSVLNIIVTANGYPASLEYGIYDVENNLILSGEVFYTTSIQIQNGAYYVTIFDDIGSPKTKWVNVTGEKGYTLEYDFAIIRITTYSNGNLHSTHYKILDADEKVLSEGDTQDDIIVANGTYVIRIYDDLRGHSDHYAFEIFVLNMGDIVQFQKNLTILTIHPGYSGADITIEQTVTGHELYSGRIHDSSQIFHCLPGKRTIYIKDQIGQYKGYTKILPDNSSISVSSDFGSLLIHSGDTAYVQALIQIYNEHDNTKIYQENMQSYSTTKLMVPGTYVVKVWDQLDNFHSHEDVTVIPSQTVNVMEDRIGILRLNTKKLGNPESSGFNVKCTATGKDVSGNTDAQGSRSFFLLDESYSIKFYDDINQYVTKGNDIEAGETRIIPINFGAISVLIQSGGIDESRQFKVDGHVFNTPVQGPKSLKLKEGDYEIQAKDEMNQDITKNANVEDGKDTNVTIGFNALVVIGKTDADEPLNLRFSVRNTETDQTAEFWTGTDGVEEVSVIDGNYKIIMYDGHGDSQERTVSVSDGEAREIEFIWE